MEQVKADKKALLRKKLRGLWKDDRSYGKRLLLSGAVMLAFCFTFIFFGPLELVAFSGGSLVFTYHDVIWPLLGLMLLVLAVCTPVLALLRGRLFNYALCLIISTVLSGYLQALLLNGQLGLLTGDSISWTDHAGGMLLDLLVWALVLAAFLFVMYLYRKLWKRLVAGVSLVLVIVQLVPTVAILCGAYEQTQTDSISGYHLSDEGFYEFSSGDNVFVFVLDRLDYDYIEKALAKDPDLLDGLDGFTSYTNAISGYARTRPALIHMLTGADELTYQLPASQYYTDAWTYGDRDLLGDLQDAGYSIEMYSNIRNLFSDPELALEYVDNVSNGYGGMDTGTTLKKLMQLSAYRYAPTALKPFFWADTNYYNEGIYEADAYSAYQFDDAAYALGFTSSTAERSGKTFKLYHFYGSHAPYSMNADGTASEEPTTVEAQTIGSFVNLLKLFDRMKELGIYENATIIITGDHGAAVSDTKPLQKATRVGLFYKPAGSAGTPLVESSAPVTTAQVAATVVKAAGADYSAYGRALDEVGEDEVITRFYYKTVCDPETFAETSMCIYEVTGDASDFANWVLVETVQIPYGYN